MAMELRIDAPWNGDGTIQRIEWNHEELKQELAAQTARYNAMVYTEDQIKDAKSDRANLNKLYKAIDTARKEMKKRCLAPYEEFEAQCKELLQIVSEPMSLIDNQLAEYEEKRKAEKMDKVREIWAAIEEKPEELQLERFFEEKMLNASTSLASIKNDLSHAVEVYKTNIEMLSGIEEYGFEAIEVYKATGDIKKALDRAKEMADIARRKAETERIKQEAAAAAAMDPQMQKMTSRDPGDAEPQQQELQWNTPQPAQEPEEKEVPRQWIRFEANLSLEDAKALAQFFSDRKIKFHKI